LYNNNLVLYDRKTATYWTQMTLLGIKGPMDGDALRNEYLLLTNYGTAISAYPDAKVLFDSTHSTTCDSICIAPNSAAGNGGFPANSFFGVVLRDKTMLFRDEALLFDYQLFTDKTNPLPGLKTYRRGATPGTPHRNVLKNHPTAPARPYIGA
jgi:hypothetical protein